MRYKAIFIAGVAVGFVAGARAGRGAYDKIMRYGHQVASHPKVQQATSSAQTKAADLAKTAAAKAPGYAMTAAKAAQAQVAQVPRYASSAREAAASKLPGRLGGTGGSDDSPGTDPDPARDGAASRLADHVDKDGNLVYPAEGSPSQVNGVRRHYTPDTP
jgi:hypothetical protein